MIIKEWIDEATAVLSGSDIITARLDVIVLAQDELQKDKAWILANPSYELPDITTDKLNLLIKRRSQHEPLAYIRGKSEFYGREFKVSEHTLEPRPETETMIELLKNLPEEFGSIIDVGTGSGAIAISAKFLYPNCKVIAIDIDKKCIQVAKQNALKHNVSIEFLEGNLLKPVNHKLERWIMCANLPYVPDSHTINSAAMFEPAHAIFGGEDGLDYYRQLFGQLTDFNHMALYILTESLPFQHDKLVTIAKQSDYSLYKADDFIQVFRYTN